VANGGAVAAGVILISLGIIGFIFPVNTFGFTGMLSEGTVVEIQEICSSGIGQLGQALNQEAKENCKWIRYGAYGVYAFLGIGVILLIVGLAMPQQKSSAMYICEYCNIAFNNPADLHNHKNSKHKKQELQSSPYLCGHCDFIGKTEEELWNHYNDKHPDEKKW